MIAAAGRERGVEKLKRFLRGSLKVKLWMIRNGLAPWMPLPVRFPYGGFCFAWKDAIGQHLYLHTPFEEGEQRFVASLLTPGMVVFDIGAHDGLYTLLASRKVGAQGRVIAFEPSPREQRRLRWNLCINGCGNVVVEPIAIGSREEIAEFFVCVGWQTGLNSLRLPRVSDPTRKVKVLVTTLDNYLAHHMIPRVDFLKVDVEGAEREVLKGASQLMSQSPRPLVMCEVQDSRTETWGYPAREIYECLQGYGYRCFSIMWTGSLRPCPRKEQYDENLVALPMEKLSQMASFIDGE